VLPPQVQRSSAVNRRAIRVAAIAGSIACGTLQAANLLVNPEFDQADSLVGWTWALDSDGGKASVCGTDSTCCTT